MAPTIQEGQKKSDQERRQTSSSRSTAGQGTGRSDYVCRMKYNNSLPDIPFDAKFITYPFEPNRFVQYKPTSLERNYKHELLTEVDLGVTIDLIDPSTYAVNPNAVLHPTDEKLLEEDIISAPDSKRTKQHNRAVSWMRRTEYISTEYNRFQPSNEQVETKVGFKVRKKLQITELYKDRESQIAAIEGTFEAAKKPVLRHPDKPNVKPLEVLPLFPDFQTWKYNCAHVVFDSDPAPRGRQEPAQVEEMSQAQIRGMVDASGDQFVAYFLPNKETLGKRKRDDEDEGLENFDPGYEYTYRLAREYNWNVKNQGSKGYEENYFFVFRANEGVFYNELAIRVRLSKRRGKGGQGGVKSSVSELIVKHRNMNQSEVNVQKQRQSLLENNPPEEDEEEEEEEMEEDGENENEQDNKEEEETETGAADDEDKASEEKDEEDEDKEDNEDNEEEEKVDVDEEEEQEEKEDNDEEMEDEDEDEEEDNDAEEADNEEQDEESKMDDEEEEEGDEESEKASSSGEEEEEEAASSEDD